MSSPSHLAALHGRLQNEGFAFLGSETMDDLLDQPQSLDDWEAFADSWNDLAPDAYLAAKGRKRRRRR
jgi:hypothetical protein